MTRRRASEIASDYLEENASALVENWIAWVRERVATDTISSLPERALRNHIPPILINLAKYLREPLELARSEMLENLRMHGQIRRDQGFSLAEVLAEFDGLAEVVTESTTEALESSGEDFSVAEILQTTQRLASGLRSISYIAMGTYARSDAERANQVAENLENLSRAITHEMNNPLNAIALGIDVIRDSMRDESMESQLDVMQASVRRCKYLLDTLRVLTIAESARAGENMVNLPDAINRVIKEFCRSADAANVSISIDEDMPEVQVEAILLYIVLANVISNSIKYCDPDKDEQTVSVRASFIEEKDDSGFCELIFEDNGMGIPAEFLPRVMQKGFRAHPHLAEGTGLGLYLVQQSAAARGGEVQVESEEGVGTTVRVRMRCLNPSADAITAEKFRVEHLMGEMIWNEVSGYSDGPDIPTVQKATH